MPPPQRLGVICRHFRILDDFHRGQRTETEKSVKCSNPPKNNSARRGGVLLPHVYLSIGTLFLLVLRSGEFPPDISWVIHRVLLITSAGVSRYRFNSSRGCKSPPSISIPLQMADMNVHLRTHVMFLPMMASRLMLSLRKAASEPTGLWSLSKTTRGGWRSTGGDVEFIGHHTPCETSDSRPSPSEADVELGSLPRLARKSGPR